MSSNNFTGSGESSFHNKPPYFDGKDYNVWCNKMKWFIKALDNQMWDVVTRGVEPTTSATTGSEGNSVTLSDTERIKRQGLDSKAVHSLFCALSTPIYNRVAEEESSKAIWDRLHVTYQGTDRVKETKLSILLSDYEAFKMKSDETIAEMIDRFQILASGLARQGAPVAEPMQVRKILRGLTEEWNYVKPSIQECQTIRPLSIDELVGTLQSYETERNNSKPEVSRGKKSIALSSNINGEGSDSDDEDEDDEELALMIKKFKRIARKGRNFKGKKPIKKFDKKQSSFEKEENKDVVCFHCKKVGHIKPKCPLLKKDKHKFEKYKKALKAETLSDSEESDEDYANLCLMAKSDSDSDSDTEVCFSELPSEVSEYIDDLCKNYKDALKRISVLKKENTSLKQQEISQNDKIEFLQKEYLAIKENRDFISKENVSLRNEMESISKRFS